MERVCVQCGGSMEGRISRAMFCSAICKGRSAEERNAEKRRIQKQQRYERNKDVELEKQKQRRAANLPAMQEKERERSRKRRIEDKEYMNRCSRQWKANNPDRAREAWQKWQKAHPGRSREWYIANRETVLKRDRLKVMKGQASRAAKLLTELTGIPHEAVEIIDENGKKTWQPRPVSSPAPTPGPQD